MKAADVANFAKPADLPKLVELLGSSDEGYRYWGVIGCIQLGKQAATPEVLQIMEKLIKTDVKDERTLDVRVTAALYLCQIEHQKGRGAAFLCRGHHHRRRQVGRKGPRLGQRVSAGFGGQRHRGHAQERETEGEGSADAFDLSVAT